MGFAKLLIFLGVVVVAAAQSISDNSTIHSDYYIDANRRHYREMVKDYDQKLHEFEAVYSGRIHTIDIQLDFLMDGLNEVEEELSTLELLSDFTQQCVKNYKHQLPGETNTTIVIRNCSDTAMSHYKHLVAAPIDTRNEMEYYLNTTFEMKLSNCNGISNSSNATNQLNYTLCVTTVISEANTFAIINHKTFEAQMAAASCSADGYVKTALDCSFTAQSQAQADIAGTKTHINSCVKGLDCAPTSGYHCQYSETIPASSVNSTNATMPNPFYGRNETYACLMLDIV
ncbi:uncharacterized protein LOC106093042 [Stomoxys calcitrans]|uniref:Protein TsetseEP domain-containing protein n=1 Tax=Stomoxys calcitrans TaxID=35570 RepID=A0A1I8QEJ3_STOCA|nr:uncharacterized protein LOC106093042 [Stomoxys calcitrans]